MKSICSLLLLTGTLISATTQAYECSFDNIKSTAPAEKFLNNGDGTITDLRFGLMWSICTVGQTFDVQSGSCTGDGLSVTTWSDAIELQIDANDLTYASYDDWRFPNIKELHSIVERACRNPAVRTEVFPDSLNAVYWSNTPDNEVNPQLHARIVDFSDGSEFFRDTSEKMYVRLVRTISR